MDTSDIKAGRQVGQHVPRTALRGRELRQASHLPEEDDWRQGQQLDEDVQPSPVSLQSAVLQRGKYYGGYLSNDNVTDLLVLSSIK